MPIPLNLTFRDMPSTPALETAVNDWVAKLERFYDRNDRIERCDVVIERPHQRHHRGQLIHVRITIAVPGNDVIVSREPRDGAHEDAYVAIRDAFRAARRQLEEHTSRLRKEVKAHVEPAHGRVTFLDVEGEWGYLESGARQIYFHHNSVIDSEPLAVGDEVRFAEEAGDKGPQASSVVPIGRNGHHQPV